MPLADAFLPWLRMIEWIGDERPEAVLIWSGGNVPEATVLAMACWWLKPCSEHVLRVAMPETAGRGHVASHSPAGLASLFASRREVTDSQRGSLAEDFERIRDETGLLRRCEDGRIIGVPTDRYDALLIGILHTGLDSGTAHRRISHVPVRRPQRHERPLPVQSVAGPDRRGAHPGQRPAAPPA